MPPLKSFLDLKNCSIEQIRQLFSLSQEIKKIGSKQIFSGNTLALLFFEPSTRTRLSFETAAHHLGLNPIRLDDKSSSSLEKGESIEDSVLNVAAMLPEAIVIRCGDEVNLKDLSEQIDCPLINAGWGKRGHPTQALLDLFTINENLGSVEGKKITFVGDIAHSRVVASHFELLQRFGAIIRLCGPEEWLIKNEKIHRFDSIDEALETTDILILLRVQLERHIGAQQFSTVEYRQKYGLTEERLKKLKDNAIFLHPGPINHGVEVDSKVLIHQKCLVLPQVTNGVFVREALMRMTLRGEI